uniref:Uncharacterized protein n=2 Tax=Octopus bimaculoides TaxID=37653 RepID=A0A0L8H5G7_OCTBM
MDDVLEILIRNGELPPSAAQEPPPTPKTTSQTPTTSTITVTQVVATSNSTSSAFSVATMLMPSPSLPLNNNVSTTAVNQRPVVSVLAPVLIKQEPDISSSPPTLTCDGTSHEFVDINDVLSQDFNNMDWTSDTSFPSLDLPDIFNDQKMTNSIVPIINKVDAANPGSSSDLDVLNLPQDSETSCNMQIDVSDWLDASFTSASLNTPISFTSSDPILTPKTQQDVLFNFVEADFSSVSDTQCGMD